MININAYGGNSIELAAYIAKKTGSFGCVVTSKQCNCITKEVQIAYKLRKFKYVVSI